MRKREWMEWDGMGRWELLSLYKSVSTMGALEVWCGWFITGLLIYCGLWYV